jgi:hypothetical protein
MRQGDPHQHQPAHSVKFQAATHAP